MTAGVHISTNLVTPTCNLSYIISITNLMKLNEFEFMSNIKNHMILPMHYNYIYLYPHLPPLAILLLKGNDMENF